MRLSDFRPAGRRARGVLARCRRRRFFLPPAAARTSRRPRSTSIRPTFSTIRRSPISNRATRARPPKKFDEIDKEHPYSDYARRAMLMSAFLHFRRAEYQDAINDARALRDALSGERRRGLRAVPDRRILFPPDPRRDARPGPRAEGHGCHGRHPAEISGLRIRRGRAQQDRGGARPAGRQGDADRPLLSGAARISSPPSTASRRWSRSTRRRATSRRRWSA